VGELEFSYSMADKQLRLVKGLIWETERFPPSARLETIIAEEEQRSRDRLTLSVARLEQPLYIRWESESPLGNLLASGLRNWTGAEIGLVNAGQILQSLEEGTVTQYRLLEICPPPINPCLIRLPGHELRLALEEALLDEFTLKPIKGFGFRGKLLGTLCVSGLRIEYAAEAEPYRKIRSVTVNGEPLDEQRMYNVGTIDMFTFGIGYMSLSRGQIVQYYLPEFIRDVLGDQLQNEEELQLCSDRSWFPVSD
jgi:2',3'-cyclic-nucleotide 2'-phosphodiesterase (5'-nucleotidase family)